MNPTSEADLRSRLDGLALFLERAAVRHTEKRREWAKLDNKELARYHEGRSTMAEQCARFIRKELAKVGPPWIGLDSLPTEAWETVEGVPA